MEQDIFDAVVEVIAKHKNIDPKTIVPDARLADLGISSLDAITVVYEIEERFGVEVPNESLEQLRTVRDIIAGMQRLIAEGN